MDLIPHIARELGLKLQQVQQALDLLAGGDTVPFITRYRKEQTGGLDEVQVRRIQELEAALRTLEDRRGAIRRAIAAQGRLDAELDAALDACTRLAELEDLYLPFRPRRRTRAGEARRRGLAPLAGILLASVTGEEHWLAGFCQGATEQGPEGNPLAERTKTAACAEGGAPPAPPAAAGPDEALLARTRALLRAPRAEVLAVLGGHAEVEGPEAALAGARDILAEWLSERAEFRAELRQAGARLAVLRARLRDGAHPEAAKFRLYHDFAELLRDLPPHRLLAVNRGEALGVLAVQMDWGTVDAGRRAAARYLRVPGSPWRADVAAAFADGWGRLLEPALSRELRQAATEQAEGHSLEVYAANLRQLLLQPPVAGGVVMGIDPGFRTGCKVAVVDPTGRLLEWATIHPHAPLLRQAEARARLLELALRHRVSVVAIGNGTAGRETEELVAAWVAENGLDIRWCMVSEAGASVYSASEEARAEFPDLDAGLRGNISIARRLQDPLAELVKIDPRSLGVGQYQHDVDPRRLGERLDAVVEDCVNAVGVDLNTASASLLGRVAGLTRRTSRAVVEWRGERGPFRRRDDLREVPGIGPAAYRQCAGFLRIRDGEDPLDNTGIHPERYGELRRLFARHGVPETDPAALAAAVREGCGVGEGLAALATELDLGLPTLTDILAELAKPGRDPRDELEPPLLRGGVIRLEDLRPGMVLEGTVRNLVDFGAFVDVGLKADGLLHVSQLSHRRVRHPMDLLHVGQRLRAAVLEVDLERGRLSLSLKALEEAPPAPRGQRPPRPGASRAGGRRPGQP